MTLLAAGTAEAALAFIEIGAVALGLAVLSRIASRIGITAVPLYLIAGLAFGEGGVAESNVSEDFISLAAEIGVLLLLFTLGLEYSESELRAGPAHRCPTRSGRHGRSTPCPASVSGLLLGWEPLAAVLLGGVTWISSSASSPRSSPTSSRLANRETPSILNLLVIEDLAMAVYLPIVAALIVGRHGRRDLATSVGIALVTVIVILFAALRFGRRLTHAVGGGSDESLLLGVFGVTLLGRRCRAVTRGVGRDRRLPRRPGAVRPVPTRAERS